MSVSTNHKPDLRDLTAAGMHGLMAEMGEKPFRARQVLHWLYKGGAEDFAAMTTLSKDLRARLAQRTSLAWMEPTRIAQSADGTKKFLFTLADGRHIESVLMPEADHHTLCVSSQVGCRQACAFCNTATLGFARGLTPAEIIGQVLYARSVVDEDRPLTNLVFMGMGEPLDNLDNLLIALEHILGEHGLQMSQRKVTVSTVGLVDKLAVLGKYSPAALAVSLNAPDDELRSRLMPVNRRFGLAELKKAIAAYPLKPTRRVTLEYVLLGGVNDRPEQAKKLLKWTAGLKVKINLIRFNPFPGSRFDAPDEADVLAFQDILAAGLRTAMIRDSRGQDIAAACGQLAARAAIDKPDDRG